MCSPKLIKRKNISCRNMLECLKKKKEFSKVHKASHGNSRISTKDVPITVANFEKIEAEKIYIMAIALNTARGMTCID